MQKLSDEKRQQISDAAARLFARRPYHEVTLETIAASAKVGKGTLYLYFKDKDDLYFSLVRQGLEDMVARLGKRLSVPLPDAWADLRMIATELIIFSRRNPHLIELMRSGSSYAGGFNGSDQRQQLSALVASVINQGIAAGTMADAHPELTAGFVLSMVRGAVLFAPRSLSQSALIRHLFDVLGHGIGAKSRRSLRPKAAK